METIESADFLSKNRKKLGKRKLILSCQGITVPQYLKCLDSILSLSDKRDIIGFGGFCIVSKSPKYERQYCEVLKQAIPKINETGIKRLHIFGLGLFRALVQTDHFTRKYNIDVSYDTSSPELNATFGRVFFPAVPSLSVVYEKSQKKKGYHPADLAMFNVKMMRIFWEEYSKLPISNDFVPGYTARNR
jgi:hypothetical protein